MKSIDERVAGLFDHVVKLDVTKEVIDQSTGEKRVINSSGSGFYVAFSVPDGTHIPVIISNKHVLEGARDIKIKTKVETDEHIFDVDLPEMTMKDVKPEMIFSHDSMDVSALTMGHYIEQSGQHGIRFKNSYINDSTLLEEPKELNIFDKVLIFGYPAGFAEKVTNHPIVYQGSFAYPPSYKFEGQDEYLLNCDSVPGNSGSIVYALTTSGLLIPIGIQYATLNHPEFNLTLTRVIKIEVLSQIKQKLIDRIK